MKGCRCCERQRAQSRGSQNLVSASSRFISLSLVDTQGGGLGAQVDTQGVGLGEDASCRPYIDLI